VSHGLERSTGGAVFIPRPFHPTAFLRTACGCERQLSVAWPPPEIMRVLLESWPPVGSLLSVEDTFKYREFRLRCKDENLYVAHYQEVSHVNSTSNT
jgi:hypothetical protein